MVEGVQVGVDGVVIAVEQVEAGLDARLDQAELREIVTAFDAVVAVQMPEEGLQRWDQGGVQAARVQYAGAPARGGVGHVRLLGAESAVHLQPEGGGFGQGLGPTLTREGVAQIEQVVRQAGANAQRQRVDMRLRRQRWCSG